MGNRQVTVTYGLDIDERAIADALPPNPTDDQINEAIREDIAIAVEFTDLPPTYDYDRPALIASVRAEIARRKDHETAEQGGEG